MKKFQSVPYSLLSDYDVFLFKKGDHYKLYEKLGSKPLVHKNIGGTYFAVWAPNASQVSVIGDFNGWNVGATSLFVRFDSSGIWEGFVPGVIKGERYKYAIENRDTRVVYKKADPFAIYAETPPHTASIVWETNYDWKSQNFQENIRENPYEKPLSIYEIHLGSWRRNPIEGNRSLTYREMAKELPSYLKDLEFTHVEFLPVTEHPFSGSWGYQTLGYFSPTSRYGPPEDFMFLVDELHRHQIGVILDWVPSHFPTDEHGLVYFDGTHLYEHEDMRKGFHPDWTSAIFNYGRYEVKSFLLSSAMFWASKCRADGLRVDAISSMLYLDYSRKDGQWIPNVFGGNENLEAIEFLKSLNSVLYKEHPRLMTIAEESTAWKGVSHPVYKGGLGFGFKWMMGWMNDTLEYFKRDPVFRKFHQGEITFSMLYYFNENFILPLSHDEVVHGKGSLISRMPGDYWQKFANLRALYAYMYFHPGGKLLFMGSELGQFDEWDCDNSLQWNLLEFDSHKGIYNLVKNLNHLYKTEPALFKNQYNLNGFEWVGHDDWQKSILTFIRKASDKRGEIIILVNFTPVSYNNYKIGVKEEGIYKEILNTDAKVFWGSGVTNDLPLRTLQSPWQGKPYSLSVTVPPLGVLALRKEP